jgi:hypothetical protein
VQDADLCRLVGAVLTGRGTAAAIVLGCAGQFVAAMIAAYLYAFLFEHLFHRAGLLAGLLIGVAHVIVAGLVMGLMPVMPLLHAGIEPPGAFMHARGPIVVAGFLLAHLAFGAVMGATYGSTRPRASRRTRR